MTFRARPAGSILATLALVLATLIATAGCSFSSGPDIGDPTAPAASANPPPGRHDPATDPAYAAYYGQKPAWSDCGKAFQCAKVTVPVDWSKPTGGTLQLAVTRTRATGKRIGSLLVNPGGPGVSGVGWVKLAALTFGSDALRGAFDLVGWDPRGTGQSAPVRCMDDRQLDRFYSSDATPDTPAEVQDFVAESTAFAQACRSRSGPSLAHLDTISTVHDMDVLRAVLGDKVLSYYGGSYGTYLGAWYAQEFPWRVGRLVLDGAVDPSLTSAQYAEGQALGFSRAVRSYVKDCLANDGCPLNGSVDDAYGQLEALIAKTDETPLHTSSGRPLTQALMATGLAQGMYEAQFWPRVSRAIAAALRGDGTSLLSLADLYLSRDASGHYGQDLTSYSPLYCLDHRETRSLQAIGADAERLGKAYPPLGDFIGWGSVSCKVWPLPAVVPTQRLTAKGAAPILVVGTTDDPATPYEWAKSLASQLSSGRLLTRVGQGHTGYRQSPCIDAAVERYLVQGTLPAAGTTCTS